MIDFAKVEFTQREYAFMEKEFGYTKEKVDAFTEDDIDKLIDDCFDIEIAETIAADRAAGDDYEESVLSERGEIAADLVTKLTVDESILDDEEDDDDD